MATINTESEPAPHVLFRPGKKRKPYRHRPGEPESAIGSGELAPEPEPPASTSAQDRDEEGLPVAEVLRLRNSRKHKLGGVGFRAGPSSLGDDTAGSDENTEQSLALHGGADAQQAAETTVVGGISTRFAPQTGLVGELVNRHMEEYVETELARRKRHAAEASAREQERQRQQQEQQQRREGSSTSTAQDQTGPSSMVANPQADFQPVLRGRLFEIDLGEEARARNVEMTERARRRLQGLTDEEDEDEDKGRHNKTRLGRDGRPLRTRNRRGSEDIKRDQLVEEFLSENKVGAYELQSEEPAGASALEEDEGAADDRIAEEFRREFMEAMAQRGRRRRAAHSARSSAKSSAKKRDDILRGPKLGGSRNARAAMRDLLLKEQASKQRR